MNNLYNKIYEAVNTGIQKALIIKDDQSDDTSVKWKEKTVSNDVNIINYFVNELRLSENDELYNNILKCYDQNGRQYIAKDFDDFISLYYRTSLAAKVLHTELNTEWINADNAVTLIKNDGKEISINDIFDHFDIAFVRIKNPLDDGNDIYLKRFSTSDEKMPFLNLENNERYDRSKINYTSNDGYTNCTNILFYSDASDKYTAVNYALSKEETINGIIYRGYIPASNQFSLLAGYYEFFDSLMLKLHGSYIDDESYWIAEATDIFSNFIMKNKDVSTLSKDNEAYCYVIYKKLDN